MIKITPKQNLDAAAQGLILIRKDTFPETNDRFDKWPQWWFVEIEKHGIRRDPISKCWIIPTGNCAVTKDGFPYHAVLLPSGKRTTVKLMKLIASKFMDWSRFSDGAVETYTSCGKRNCVNPAHIVVALSHHRQRGKQ